MIKEYTNENQALKDKLKNYETLLERYRTEYKIYRVGAKKGGNLGNLFNENPRMNTEIEFLTFQNTQNKFR